jgi:DNA-binding CsgD family transcriptional regulator
MSEITPKQAESQFIYGKIIDETPPDDLTPKQLRVWELRQKGYTMDKCANIMGISNGSVWNHIVQIRLKNHEA